MLGRVEHCHTNNTWNIWIGAVFKFRFHNEGGHSEKCCFELFLQAQPNFLVEKFQGSLSPPSCFSRIDHPFLTNIWWIYFSLNLFTVLYQPKVELSISDQNWAKNRPLLFEIFNLPNFHSIQWDSCIVQCEAIFEAISKMVINHPIN